MIISSYVIGGRDYDQTVMQKYESIVDPRIYDLTPYDAIPVLLSDSVQQGSQEAVKVYNDETLWKFEFYQQSDGGYTFIAPITCNNYIQKYLGDLNEEQKRSIYEELGGEEYSQNYLCPDTDSILLTRTHISEGEQLYIRVSLSDELAAQALEDYEAVGQIIKDSESLLSLFYITQYFDPETSMESGYNNYIVVRWMQNGLRFSKERLLQFVTLSQNQCTYYNSIYFDLTQFGSFFGTDCETYSVTDTESIFYESDDVTAPVFTQILMQDRSYHDTTWSVNSIDIVLGLIGGFIGLIWDMLGYTIGGYQSFKFSTALISELYTTTDESRLTKDAVPRS